MPELIRLGIAVMVVIAVSCAWVANKISDQGSSRFDRALISH
jgi:hypothetical protein